MKENLPSYLAEAKPNPAENRLAWFKNIAPSYAGIILWFVFWQNTVNFGGGAGGLAHGICVPVLGVVLGAVLCYLLYYKTPALLGLKSGMPLYVIGSSVFGAKGGIAMPGLLMGLLQFGWVGVNIFFSSILLHETLSFIPLWAIMVVWGALATFMGLVGIKYVAKISTYLPLIPLVILIILVAKTASTVSNFDPSVLQPALDAAKTAGAPASKLGIISAITVGMIGFFATAGAAGADFATGARNEKDVRWGGLVGITLFMILTAVAAIVIVAGAYGDKETAAKLISEGKSTLNATAVMPFVLGSSAGKICMFLLALAAFPAACFSAMIAANSFKTMLPKINANASVAVGGIAAIILAVTGVAEHADKVFNFFGASFAPICGALTADYILAGGKWSGARAGFNPAGWIAWAVGFAIGVLPMFGLLTSLPFNPVVSFLAGAVIYAACMKAGFKSKLLDE
ncbi:MAG: hypothetical protein IKS15_03410 [Opitutales bacterium]|nr:hypothetical protein [Opitutales bacterium]